MGRDYQAVLLKVKDSFKQEFGRPLPDQVLNFWLDQRIRDKEKAWFHAMFSTTSNEDLIALAGACLKAPAATVEEFNAYAGIVLDNSPPGLQDPFKPSTDDAKYAAAVEVMKMKRAVKRQDSLVAKKAKGRPKKVLLTTVKDPGCV